MKATALARGRGALHARRALSALTMATCLTAAAGTAAAAAAAAGRVSPLLSQATDLGPVSGSSSIELTLWLKLHDEQGLDALLADEQSGKTAYRSAEQVFAQHSPSADAAAKVSAYLKAQGFNVTGVGQRNLFVRASASVARVQSTFQVELHQYAMNGRTFRASTHNATLPSALVPLVTAVGGLSEMAAEPQIARVGKPVASISRQTDAEALRAHPRMLAKGQPNGLFFSAQCFYPAQSQSFASSDGTISATYQGNRYGAPISNQTIGTLPPCGYQPSDMYSAYNLSRLYEEGLTGKGTTIAIVDAYGSTTIAQDAAVFSQAMGLPPLDLTIVGTPTESNFSTDGNSNWAAETTIDVEWAHSIAPGAKIVLVVAPTNSFTDLFNGIITAAQTRGVVAISNSWSGFDVGIAGDSEFYKAADAVLKMAGAAGESVNFSTGDFGNNAAATGGLYTTTGWPGSSPYATAIGGVSVALDTHKHIAWQTSWGTNLTEIVDTPGTGALDVPNNEGFVFGGTGGESDVYPKPSWQTGVPGQRRQTPDISWVADPYTGVEIIYTGDAQGDQFIDVYGGTSVACPMFSGLWAIATQHAHHRLGQAAPYLYRLPSGAITDVGTNPGSPNNVTGTIMDSGGTNPINSWELAAPLYNQANFVSALYNSPFSTRWFVITFGLDTTLTTGPGWDNATGLGTPNGWNFVHAFGGDD